MDLNSVLEETLLLAQHPFKTAQVNVVRNYNEKLPAVLGSTTRLQQVFLNLFMNARDSMPGRRDARGAHQRGRTARSKLRSPTREWGSFAPEHLHRHFDPFFTHQGDRPVAPDWAFRVSLRCTIKERRGKGRRALDAREGNVVPAGISLSPKKAPSML